MGKIPRHGSAVPPPFAKGGLGWAATWAAPIFSRIHRGALTDPYGENPPSRLRRATPFCERGLGVGGHTVLPLPFSGYIGGFWPTHMEKIPRHGSAVPPPFPKGGFKTARRIVAPYGGATGDSGPYTSPLALRKPSGPPVGPAKSRPCLHKCLLWEFAPPPEFPLPNTKTAPEWDGFIHFLEITGPFC